ncbi:MAG: O-methyltransferase [Clostridia bacterium]
MEKLLKELHEYAKENNVPIVLDDTKEKLEKIVKDNNFKETLEIGTAIGYSGLLILKNSNCNLTTIEKDIVRFDIAKKSFDLAGVTSRVTQILGDAVDYIYSTSKKFDFIFLDGPKGQYYKWLPFLKNMLNENGVLLADNVLFKGMVKKEGLVKHKNRTIVLSLRSFIKDLETDNNFDTSLFECGDGIIIAKKMSKNKQN